MVQRLGEVAQGHGGAVLWHDRGRLLHNGARLLRCSTWYGAARPALEEARVERRRWIGNGERSGGYRLYSAAR
jgi:hypothetical protein